MNYQREPRKSRDDVWPLRRADGRKWNEPSATSGEAKDGKETRQ